MVCYAPPLSTLPLQGLYLELTGALNPRLLFSIILCTDLRNFRATPCARYKSTLPNMVCRSLIIIYILKKYKNWNLEKDVLSFSNDYVYFKIKYCLKVCMLCKRKLNDSMKTQTALVVFLRHLRCPQPRPLFYFLIGTLSGWGSTVIYINQSVVQLSFQLYCCPNSRNPTRWRLCCLTQISCFISCCSNSKGRVTIYCLL